MKFPVLCILFCSVFLSVFSQLSIAAKAPDGFAFYTVKAGDTLSEIAPREHWDIIKRVNRIDEAHLIIGKKILVPVNLKKAKKFLPVPEFLKRAKKSKRALYVFLDKQYFGAYQNGRLIFWGPISSGTQENATPKGNYKALWKAKLYHSREYDVDMPFAINISSDGFFLHEQSLPGRPASHGCIRLLRTDAQKIFNWIKKNDPVILTKTVPNAWDCFFHSPKINKATKNARQG